MRRSSASSRVAQALFIPGPDPNLRTRVGNEEEEEEEREGGGGGAGIQVFSLACMRCNERGRV